MYMYVIQVDGAPVALQECFIPLNPVRFSPEMLVAMDRVVPSALGGVPTGNKVINLKVISHCLNFNILSFPPSDLK